MVIQLEEIAAEQKNVVNVMLWSLVSSTLTVRRSRVSFLELINTYFKKIIYKFKNSLSVEDSYAVEPWEFIQLCDLSLLWDWAPWDSFALAECMTTRT